jgi:NAD(P)-dependent dehydrogenase (short-subunit alcohol dehydrogenase family)
MKFSFNLEGKVAVVTGAGSGIGEDIATKLAEEDVKVVVNGRNKDKINAVVKKIQGMGKEAIAIGADVSKKEEVEALFDQVIKTYGRVDFLVNNAGTNIPKPLVETDEDTWDQIMDINTKGTFLCSKAAARQMIQQKFGRIVSISSVAAQKTHPGRAHYGASKAAVDSLTRTMALELAPHNIRVNAIAPGLILTPLSSGLLDQATRDRFAQLKPIGRLGRVEEISYPTLFLLSEGSSFMTGQVIVVDGGLMIKLW